MDNTKSPPYMGGISEEERLEDNKFIMSIMEKKIKELYDLTFLFQNDRNGVYLNGLTSIKSYIRMAYDETMSFSWRTQSTPPTFQEIYTHKMKTDSEAAHAIVNKLRKEQENRENNSES